MLNALAKHALLDLHVNTVGDLEIDAHHTVEDTAIGIGQALREALGDKRGIRRFGDATVPLDEALVHCTVDLSGRPYCVHTGEPDGQVYAIIGGDYAGSLTQHVFETLAFNAAICIHIRVLVRPRPAPHRRGPVQGLRPGAAGGRRAGSAAAGDPLDQGRSVSKKVVLLDYGSGNIRSGERALQRVGADVTVTVRLQRGAERRRSAGPRRRRLRGLHDGPARRSVVT